MSQTQQDNNVKVVIRCRPLNSDEKKKKCSSVIQCESSRKEVSVSINNEKIAAYYFDRVFDPTASQEFVYRSIVAESVEDAISGFNCTIFAYGQTGTGKTFTMEGKRNKCEDKKSPFWYGDKAGMIPRAAQHIFQRLNACGKIYKISVSYTELYNNEIIDLLADSNNTKKTLSIRQDEGKKGCSVTGLKHIIVKSPEDIFKILDIASQKRIVAETLLNDRSSRSHCIFTVTIQTKEQSIKGESIKKIGKLNLVDLAGSENTKRSGVEEIRKKEASMINKSLLSLRRVITALATNESYIPFRDSNLTRLLQESLGGKSKTCMIATISIADECIEETKSTLQYAFSAKSIKNAPVLNQKLAKSAQLQEYKEHINTLQDQLAASRSDEGFYVDKETWDNHLQLLEKITNIEKTIKEKDNIIIEMQKYCDSCAIDLELSKNKKNEIQVSLHQTKENLNEISKNLIISKNILEDEINFVLKNEKLELSLQEQNENYIDSISNIINDIKYIHNNINEKRNIHNYNCNLLENIFLSINNNINLLENIFTTLENESSSHKSILLKEFLSLSKELSLLNNNIKLTINSCSLLLSNQHKNFNNIIKKLKDQYNNYNSIYNNITLLTSKDYKNNLNEFKNNFITNIEKLTNLSESQYSQFNNLSNNFTNNILKKSLENEFNLLNENSNIFKDIQDKSIYFNNKLLELFKHQQYLIEQSKIKYYQSMKLSKDKFMKEIEKIYDNNITLQNENFENEINNLQDKINTTKSKINLLNENTNSIYSKLHLLQNSQNSIQKNKFNIYNSKTTKLYEKLNDINHSHSDISLKLKNILETNSKDISNEWIILQNQLENYNENQSSELLNHSKNIDNLFISCNDNICNSIDNKFLYENNQYNEQIENCVLPKQISHSEMKINERIQTQKKKSHLFKSLVDNVSKNHPKFDINKDIPNKDKQYTIPNIIPKTDHHHDIILKRRNGEINVLEIEEDSSNHENNNISPKTKIIEKESIKTNVENINNENNINLQQNKMVKNTKKRKRNITTQQPRQIKRQKIS